MNCISNIHMFKSSSDASKALVWGMIRTEQERILAEVCDNNTKQLKFCKADQNLLAAPFI